MNQPVQKSAARKRGRPPATEAETGRTNDPERTMADILEVATAEFAAKGLAGARIDEIAALTRTSKRMIYYYFESKEGLYRAVLEKVYEQIRLIESGIDIEGLDPEEALRELVRVTFDWHHKHPDFVRLVMNENIHQGEHLGAIRQFNAARDLAMLGFPTVALTEQQESNLAGRALKGQKPEAIGVAAAEKFETVINARTAAAALAG